MYRASASTQDDLRRLNLSRLLRRLHMAGPATRSDLVAHTGLNRSTVGDLVAQLAEAGLVREGAGLAGQVGRPSLLVEPVPESAVVIAVELGVDRTQVALVGLGGTVLATGEDRHPRSPVTPKAAAKAIATMTARMLDEAPTDAALVGIGIAVPGIIDRYDGRVRVAPNLGWHDVPLGEVVQRALLEVLGTSPRVVISNDADLGALAEHARGAAVAHRNLIFLIGEVGIGGGIIIDGDPMGGAGGYGGEVGHVVIDPRGATCRCGSQGCWETTIGRHALIRAAGRDPEADDVVDVIDAALHGDVRARAALDEAGRWLGVGLANLVNVFNPQAIVLGGHLRLLHPHVAPIMMEQINRALPGAREQVQVLVAALDSDSSIVGAAESAFAGLLDDPIGVIGASQRAAS